MKTSCFVVRAVAGALAFGCAAASSTLAGGACPQAFENYGGFFRQIDLPPIEGASFGVAGGAMADGRLILLTGESVFLETGVGSGSFDVVGTIGVDAEPTFIRVSPDGSMVAAGVNPEIMVFPVSALGTPGAPADLAAASTVFSITHFTATWLDDATLAVDRALLDVTSDPMNPDVTVMVAGTGSAGIAFDSDGRFYTGEFIEGRIRAFDPAEWEFGPADFELDGVLIGTLSLSVSALAFDSDGNLFVGGGATGSETDVRQGIIAASAVQAAAMGMGPVDADDPAQVRRVGPETSAFPFFGVNYNPATGEMYVTNTDFFQSPFPVTWWATSGGPRADLDGDGVVGAGDLGVLLGLWGTADESADLSGDGVVGAADLAILLGSWGCS
ncbi:MAG: hypothetical protein EA376_00365 [Phycisphaeraceae bacterium]|nr:MAG: hypothetical protein EA376_00365 [Phycisphaeraceae bacterium]